MPFDLVLPLKSHVLINKVLFYILNLKKIVHTVVDWSSLSGAWCQGCFHQVWALVTENIRGHLTLAHFNVEQLAYWAFQDGRSAVYAFIVRSAVVIVR